MALQEFAEEHETEQLMDELQPGTQLLHGQYTISRYINNGGFGITYLAKDSLDRDVVIKECFPGAFCRRTNTIVSARSRAHQNELKSIIRLFVQEAHSLSKLIHPNIVGVHQVFEDNDTAYMAIDYVDGKDLMDVIDDNDVLKPEQIVDITKKLLDAIGFIHQHDILHRDISPDNILINSRGEPILIDFGAAREHAANTKRALSALRVVKDGYSPQEFYIAGGHQGPWSDLYAFAASLYHVISGEIPVNGQARLGAIAEDTSDPYQPLAGRFKGYPPRFLEAIDKALAVMPKARLQSAEEWLEMLENDSPAELEDERPKLLVVDGNPEQMISDLLQDEERVSAQEETEATTEEGIQEEPEAKVHNSEFAEDFLEMSESEEESEHKSTQRQISLPPIADPEPVEQSFASEPKSKKPAMAVSVLALLAALGIVGVVGYQFMGGGEEAAPAEETSEAATLTPEADVVSSALVVEETAITEEAPAADETLTESVVVADPVSEQPVAEESVVEIVETADAAVVIETNVAVETIEVPVEELTAQPIEETVAEPVELAAATTPVAEEPVLAEAVEAEAEAPAAPVLSEVPLMLNQIVFAHWDVDMPFQTSLRKLRNADVALVTGVDEDADLAAIGDWVKRGAAIYTINGTPVDANTPFATRVLNDLQVDPDGYTRATIRYKDALTRRFQRGLLAVPVVRTVGLGSGLLVELRNVDGAWAATVANQGSNPASDLRKGDVIMQENISGRVINSPDALDAALDKLVTDNIATAEFKVRRDGGMTVAAYPLVTAN